MDVAVHQHTASVKSSDVDDAGDPALVDRNPGVALEVEVVPLLTELGRRPVGIVVDRAIASLDEREHLVEVVGGIGSTELHGDAV
jgi:hypothetical protein